MGYNLFLWGSSVFRCVVVSGYICLLLSTAACDFYHVHVNEELVRSELLQLNNDIQTGSLSLNSWDILIRLAQTSSDTRRFLSQLQEYPALSQLVSHKTLEFIEYVRSHARMKIDELGQVGLMNFERPMMADVMDTAGIFGIIRGEYQKIQENNEVYAYEVMDRFYRKEYLCKYECGCYVNKFIEALQEADSDVLLLRVAMRGGGYGIHLKRSFNNAPIEALTLGGLVEDSLFDTWYLYHVSLVIIDHHLRAGVVDPIMFGDANIRPLSSWYDRIEGPEISLRVSFY